MERVQIGEGVSIAVGTRLRVRVEGIDLTFTSRFLGALDTEDVLISLDTRLEHFESRLAPGLIFEAGFLADDAYHRFRARFERLISDPVRAVVLNFPEDVINIEQRLLPRTACSVPARVDIRKSVEGTIRDISPKGCRLALPVGEAGHVPLAVGDRIRIRLRAPGSPHGYIVEGQVRRVSRGDGVAEAGVGFDDLPELLRHFIETLTRGRA